MRSTIDRTAREAIGTACEDVQSGGEHDLVDGIVPGLVARPTSTEQVSAVLRAAADAGLSVVPRGRGTKMSWGVAPWPSVDLVVDVSAMDQVLEHAAGDLIVATQAGALLSDVQEVVGQERQRLSVDETVPGASIGGTLAANTSGPHRLVTGTIRDLLIGITVVRADGVIAKAGGRVVKNVAGYDLGKLMIGSFGTLAVVTEALFRLHPLPDVQRWVSVPVNDPEQAHQVVQSVVHAQAVPAAVEIDWPHDGEGRVDVLIEGKPDGVEGRVTTVCKLLGDTSTTSDTPPTGWSTYPWSSGGTALKLTLVLSGLPTVVAAVRAAGADLRGSAGTGVVYAALPSGTPTDQVASAVETLRAACGSHQGTLVVVDAPAEVKQAVDVWGPVPALPLMRRVKDQFDPDHRLSPGRFVGGI